MYCFAFGDCQEEAKARASKPLAVQLGDVLASKKTSISELMREWDQNADGDVTKMEFRQVVRKLLPKMTDVKEIDSTYDSMDIDGSGKLDANEIGAALKKLQTNAAAAAKQAKAAQATAEKLYKRAACASNILETTKRYEEAALELERATGKSVGAQLGALTNKKGLKAGDVVQLWDKSGDGVIDKSEVCRCASNGRSHPLVCPSRVDSYLPLFTCCRGSFAKRCWRWACRHQGQKWMSSCATPLRPSRTLLDQASTPGPPPAPFMRLITMWVCWYGAVYFSRCRWEWPA